MAQDFQELFDKASAAAKKAYEECVPKPMMVKNNFSSQTYYVEDGMCGFAWVNVPGNKPFGRWLKAQGKGGPGYPKGWELWSSQFIEGDVGQSYERKLAGARAFAKVISEAGHQIAVGHRLD